MNRRRTDKQIKDALKSAGGFTGEAAKILKIHRKTIESRIKKSKQLQSYLHEIIENNLDYAESKLLELIKQSHPASIYFYLKCKGKHRGWIERQEVTDPNPPKENVSYEIVTEYVYPEGTEKPNDEKKENTDQSSNAGQTG